MVLSGYSSETNGDLLRRGVWLTKLTTFRYGPSNQQQGTHFHPLETVTINDNMQQILSVNRSG
jgi:hypothetical protein